jgi:cytochrome P450
MNAPRDTAGSGWRALAMGQDTTAATVSCMLCLLADNPDALRAVVAQVRRPAPTPSTSAPRPLLFAPPPPRPAPPPLRATTTTATLPNTATLGMVIAISPPNAST